MNRPQDSTAVESTRWVHDANAPNCTNQTKSIKQQQPFILIRRKLALGKINSIQKKNPDFRSVGEDAEKRKQKQPTEPRTSVVSIFSTVCLKETFNYFHL